MDVDQAPVKMMVVDGICFGPKHCAHPGHADDHASGTLSGMEKASASRTRTSGIL